jgi:hypothetical protein
MISYHFDEELLALHVMYESSTAVQYSCIDRKNSVYAAGSSKFNNLPLETTSSLYASAGSSASTRSSGS